MPRTPEQLLASVSSLIPLEVSSLVKNLKLAVSFPGAVPHSQPYPFPFTREEVIDDYAATYPYYTVGTLAYTDPRDGSTKFCTAAVVDTPNGNTIFTDGHCIGENNVLFTNFKFIPANYLGTAPFGVWTACGRYPTSSWLRNSDYTNDIGAIKVCPRPSDGASLKNVLGGTLGFAWSQGRNWNWTMVGYPASTPFTYQKQYFCQSSHGQDDPASNLSTNPPIGIGCDLGKGASGSPFILDFGRESPEASFINGVYSYDYGSQSRAAYASYFGQNAKNLYDAVVANGG